MPVEQPTSRLVVSEGNVMTMLSPLGICWGDEGVGWEALDAGGGVLPSVGVAINEAVSCVLVSLIGAGFGAVATTASKVAQVVAEEGVFAVFSVAPTAQPLGRGRMSYVRGSKKRILCAQIRRTKQPDLQRAVAYRDRDDDSESGFPVLRARRDWEYQYGTLLTELRLLHLTYRSIKNI